MSRPQIRLILDGVHLPDKVYEEYDVSGLDDILFDIDETGSLFELDGSDYGPETVTYYIYCDHPDEFWAQIRETVQKYPLCSGAGVQFLNENGEICKEFRLERTEPNIGGDSLPLTPQR